MRIIKIALLATILISSAFAANLTSPATPVPDARIALGLTYNLEGFELYQSDVEAYSLTNRLNISVTFAPISNINIGVDFGAGNVAISAADAIRDYHGDIGFSGGLNTKLSSNFINDRIAFMGIMKANWFLSEGNQESQYSGMDLSAGAGPIVHINNFGYIAAGLKYQEIVGKNMDYSGNEGKWSNDETLGGFIAIDYFPKSELISNYIPYITFELGVFPGAGLKEKETSVKDLSFSLSFGAITKRLYGKKSELNWRP